MVISFFDLTLNSKVLSMNDKNPIEDLKEIRRMMEQSSKFLSLSGLSGVVAGIIAMAGAAWAYFEVKQFYLLWGHYLALGSLDDKADALELRLALIAVLVLVLAVSFGVFFTWLKAKKQSKSIFTKLSLRLVISLMVPLFFGGMFTLGLYFNGLYMLVPPATLIFYGLALLSASKYVHVDVKYLALSEMTLGVVSLFVLGSGFHHWADGLLFWAAGFGVLHIVYGTIMYFKYDYKGT